MALSDLIDRSLRSAVMRRAIADWSDVLDLQRRRLNEGLRRVAPLTHGRALDVGCGDRPYEHIFRPYVTAYVGVEQRSTFGLTQASARASGPDIVYEGPRLPFGDGEFDTVLSIEVLEHTPHPNELLAEMSRVLKKDGILIITVPFAYRLHEEPHDYFRYTPHGLATLCAEAGLRVKHVYDGGGLWSVIGHDLNVFLAYRIARMRTVAQSAGKLSMEGPVRERMRSWSLPFVVPAMLGIAVGARLFDRIIPEPKMTLGYVVVAERMARS